MKSKNGDVIVPVAPKLSEMEEGYSEFIEDIKHEIAQQRLITVLNVNSSLILLYWKIGNAILEKQKNEGWGTKVIRRMEKDLKDAFPDMSGFSYTNLRYMQRFAEAWPDYEIVKKLISKIPWRTNRSLLDKLNNSDERIWYAKKTIENGWSSNVLEMQIQSHLIDRTGKSVNNFDVSLPPEDSDMTDQMFKDPYVFDFIGTDKPRRELDVERDLTEHIQNFLLELGQGFAFVGRQVHLEVDGQDFYLDLLFYHLELRCFVVIELKTGKFEPGYISQLNFYQNVVNDVYRHEGDGPTIGLLLVKGKNKKVVKYSLEGINNPIGVSEWTDKIVESIPDNIKSSLPTIEELESELQ